MNKFAIVAAVAGLMALAACTKPAEEANNASNNVVENAVENVSNNAVENVMNATNATENTTNAANAM